MQPLHTALTTAIERSMSSHALSPDGDPIPTRWVEDLFARLTAIVGSAMGTVYAGADPELVKSEWAEALAGFSAEEVKRGIAATRTRRFPPNLPEFLHLCRPALDPEVAWHEAEAGMRAHAAQQDFAWSHPAVFWAAREFSYELRTSNFTACRKRWEPTLAAMWSLRAWPAVPDATAPRIASSPTQQTAANSDAAEIARELLKEQRRRMTGFATKAEQESAMAAAERQALSNEPGVNSEEEA
jgi:hypothetical protein